jgi:hypothetical protein
MRNARIFRQELDLWKLAWQQIETFLDRIDGAQDQDEPHRRKLDALLRAARAVEHERATRVDDRPLSDPVVDTMPTHWYSEQQGVQEVTDPWLLEFRKWRLPGMDEVELAVGNLITLPGEDTALLEQIRLLPDRNIFEVRLDKTDRRFPQSDNGLFMIRLPSYPRAASGNAIVGTGGAVADITEDANTSSLFSQQARYEAAMEPSAEDDPVRRWSNLCAARRSALPGTRAQYDDTVTYVGPAAEPSWHSPFIAEALQIVQLVRSGQAALANTAVLATIETAARAAANAIAADAADLNTAADVIEAEGARQAAFPAQLRATATALGGRPAAFRAVADAAAALRAALTSVERAEQLEQALLALEIALIPPPLSLEVVEDGPLRAEIDAAVEARVTYPDGTLRILRALEWSFLTVWPAQLRRFKTRHEAVLLPLLARFRKPFTDSLAALVRGGYTGLTCEGLHLAPAASIGTESLTTDQPASLLPTLDGAIEAGQVGILAGDRPTALVILGLDTSDRRVALKISPLLVSTAPQAEDVPGSPGTVTGDQPIACVAPGLTAEELRLGEAAAGRAGDGLVHQTVALWSRLCLVFGWLEVERALQGSTTLTEAHFGARLIPDPSTLPLRQLSLYGEIPPNTMTLVIQGASDAYWERSTYPPQPRVARPREMLLLRGRGESEEGEPAPMLQSAVEVEMVYRTTGFMLERMETADAALLSTSPLPPDAGGTPRFVCGPEEDVIIMLLSQSWQTKKLVGDITLRRDFLGFDAPNLATERLLPVSFLQDIMGSNTPINDGGIDRHDEFAAALKLVADWTRYAR